MSELTPVQQYYKGKTVFITGASGFMGKVLLEKLLYSCSDLKEIIMICRAKRGKTPESRLEDMFKLPIFQRIRDEKPNVLKKVTIFNGDITNEWLGLSDENLKYVGDNTNIVFHMAATLKLEGNLTDAVSMNLAGTRRAIDVAKKMKNLEAFVHLSTAFCNCDQEVAYEKVYDFPHRPEDIMRLAEWMDVKTLDSITPRLLEPHPNTYTYTKRLAELYVRDQYKDMPVIIARPSIVTPAYVEPFPGWVDNLNGPIGVMIAAGKGVLRSILCDGNFKAEIIPVDFTICGLIVMPFTFQQMEKKPAEVPVYNLTLSGRQRHTWKWIVDRARVYNEDYPSSLVLWHPDGHMTTNKFYHWFSVIFFMWFPALLVDILLTIFGQRRFMIRVQKRIAIGLEVLQFFTTREWDFKCTNYLKLAMFLTPEDAKQFHIYSDDNEYDAQHYMRHCMLGGRTYVMKESPATIPRAKVLAKIMYILDRVCKILFFYWLIRWLISKFAAMDLMTELLRD